MTIAKLLKAGYRHPALICAKYMKKYKSVYIRARFSIFPIELSGILFVYLNISSAP